MPITTSGKTIIYKSNCNLNPVPTFGDLPIVGADNTLYIVQDTAAIYIWDGAEFIVYDSRPYKVYTALVGQEDEDDPTATVLENTTGYDVEWTRATVGQYVGTFVDAPIDVGLVSTVSNYVDVEHAGGIIIYQQELYFVENTALIDNYLFDVSGPPPTPPFPSTDDFKEILVEIRIYD